MRLTVQFLFCLPLSAACSAGCASDGVPFSLRSGPEFAESNGTISVFGLFKDGALTPNVATALGPKPWSFLGASGCEAAYGAALVGAHPSLAKTTDDYARNNGVTDDLLAVFGPAAEGELIMTVTMAGHVTIDDAGTETPPASQPQSSPSRGGGGGHGHRGGGGTTPSPPDRSHAVDRGAIELSASFYAVGAERSVTIAETRYLGPSTEAAWKAFSAKLAATVPSATCRGWNLDARVDANRLQRLVEKSTASSSPE
jgi:hypothetical protein